MDKLKLIVINPPNEKHKGELIERITKLIQVNYYS